MIAHSRENAKSKTKPNVEKLVKWRNKLKMKSKHSIDKKCWSWRETKRGEWKKNRMRLNLLISNLFLFFFCWTLNKNQNKSLLYWRSSFGIFVCMITWANFFTCGSPSDSRNHDLWIILFQGEEIKTIVNTHLAYSLLECGPSKYKELLNKTILLIGISRNFPTFGWKAVSQLKVWRISHSECKGSWIIAKTIRIGKHTHTQTHSDLLISYSFSSFMIKAHWTNRNWRFVSSTKNQEKNLD